MDTQLAKQNQLTAWRDCEYAGKRHRWSRRYELQVWVNGTKYHKCERCPVWKKEV